MTLATRQSFSALAEALTVALSTVLHEDADPECTGEPSFFLTQAKAESLVEQALQMPIVQNALDKPHIQAFLADGNVFEAAPGEWREVYCEECPDPLGRCDSEYHHFGRGDHMVPVDPGWSPT